jgi:hypothetical protein
MFENLECGGCWCDIVVKSTRARWSEDFSEIPDPNPDCVRFNRTEHRRADLHTHQCLLTDVVPEALPEEPGLQPLLGRSPGVTVKFVFCRCRGFQNLSLLIVLRLSGFQNFYSLSLSLPYVPVSHIGPGVPAGLAFCPGCGSGVPLMPIVLVRCRLQTVARNTVWKL